MYEDGFIWDYSIYKNLEEFIRDKYYKTSNKKYAIIYGDSGNGKTTIVYKISKLLDADVLRFNSDELGSTEIMKIINMRRLDTRKPRIIFFDNFDDYRRKINFIDMHKYTNHPIIYSCIDIRKTFNTARFKRDYEENNILLIHIKKPLPSELKQLLEDICKKNKIELDENTLNEISQKSKSVRHAINSLYSATLPESKETKSIKVIESLARSIMVGNDDSYRLLSYLALVDKVYNSDPMRKHTKRKEENLLNIIPYLKNVVFKDNYYKKLYKQLFY